MEDENKEDEHALRLRQARAEGKQQQASTAGGAAGPETEKLERLAANKDKIVTYVLVVTVGGGNALLNYFGIGAVPLLGDVIDLGAGVTLSGLLLTLEGHPRIKAQLFVWAFTAVELIPAADIVSPQAIGTAIALVIAWRAGSKAEEQLEQMRAGEAQTLEDYDAS